MTQIALRLREVVGDRQPPDPITVALREAVNAHRAETYPLREAIRRELDAARHALDTSGGAPPGPRRRWIPMMHYQERCQRACEADALAYARRRTVSGKA